MLATFQHAMQARTSTVAGIKLGPLTLAQLYCLHAWESPLVVGGPVTLADFATALWTCKQPCFPFEKFTDDVCRGKPDKAMAKLGKRYDVQRFEKDVAALREHIGWHCDIPPRFSKTESNKGCSAPWPMVIAVQVMPLLGESETWTAPFPRVMAYKIALDNAGGDSTWKTEQEQEQGYANGGNS